MPNDATLGTDLGLDRPVRKSSSGLRLMALALADQSWGGFQLTWIDTELFSRLPISREFLTIPAEVGEVPVAREHRKLAAIVAADVVGYSRLMGRDESGTLAR